MRLERARRLVCRVGAIFAIAAAAVSVAEGPRKIGRHTTPEMRSFVVRVASGTDLRLEEAGLTVIGNRNLLPGDYLVSGDAQKVFRLAKRPEVRWIFAASPELLTDAEVAACPGPAWTDRDRPDAPAGYVAESPGWTRTNGTVQLGYKFGSLTERLPPTLVQSEIVRAMHEWGKWAPIQFSPAEDSSSARCIHIFFGRGSHGDGYAFDGPGKMLAHTFYPAPPNSEPLAGDLHLDADENWAVGTVTDIYTVTLHELGHALGLGHSDQPNSVMYPYYRYGTPLSSDDISGLQALYGGGSGGGGPDPGPLPALALSVSTPATSSLTVAADSLAIAGTSTGAVTVVWRNDRGGSAAAAGTSRWSATVPLFTGSNNVSVMAIDASGKSVSRLLAITRQSAPVPDADSVSPSLKISFPASSYATGAASLTCQGSAADNVGVTQVVWSNSAGGSGTANGTTAWNALVPLQKGTNVLTFRARDAAGNEAWRAVVVSRR